MTHSRHPGSRRPAIRHDCVGEPAPETSPALPGDAVGESGSGCAAGVVSEKQCSNPVSHSRPATEDPRLAISATPPALGTLLANPRQGAAGGPPRRVVSGKAGSNPPYHSRPAAEEHPDPKPPPALPGGRPHDQFIGRVRQNPRDRRPGTEVVHISTALW